MTDKLSGLPVLLLHQSQYLIQTKRNTRKYIQTDLNKTMVSPNGEVIISNEKKTICEENYTKRRRSYTLLYCHCLRWNFHIQCTVLKWKNHEKEIVPTFAALYEQTKNAWLYPASPTKYWRVADTHVGLPEQELLLGVNTNLVFSKYS